MIFMNKHHKVSFSYHFIFDRIMRVLVTFYERGHFVILIIKSMHLINLHFWTYLAEGGGGVEGGRWGGRAVKRQWMGEQNVTQIDPNSADVTKLYQKKRSSPKP